MPRGTGLKTFLRVRHLVLKVGWWMLLKDLIWVDHIGGKSNLKIVNEGLNLQV